MTKEQFINLTKNVILPLFTGAQIVGEEISSGRDSEVAQGANGAMLLKPNKQDEYRLIIKRNQPFKNKDISLVKFIMTELMLVDEYEAFDGAYKKNLQSLAIEKAICKSLSEESSDVLLELVEELTKWAERTYEGRNLTFKLLLTNKLKVVRASILQTLLPTILWHFCLTENFRLWNLTKTEISLDTQFWKDCVQSQPFVHKAILTLQSFATKTKLE